jgi:hypothetical protein
MTKTPQHQLDKQVDDLADILGFAHVDTADGMDTDKSMASVFTDAPAKDNVGPVSESTRTASAAGVDAATQPTASPASTWTPTVTPSIAQASACSQSDPQERERADLALRLRVSERDMEAMRLQVEKLSTELVTCQAQKASLQAEVDVHKPEVPVMMTPAQLRQVEYSIDRNHKPLNNMGKEKRTTHQHVSYLFDGILRTPPLCAASLNSLQKEFDNASDDSDIAVAAVDTALEAVRTTNGKLVTAEAHLRLFKSVYDEIKEERAPTSMKAATCEASALAGRLNNRGAADYLARKQDALNAEVRLQLEKESKEKEKKEKKATKGRKFKRLRPMSKSDSDSD